MSASHCVPQRPVDNRNIAVFIPRKDTCKFAKLSGRDDDRKRRTRGLGPPTGDATAPKVQRSKTSFTLLNWSARMRAPSVRLRRRRSTERENGAHESAGSAAHNGKREFQIAKGRSPRAPLQQVSVRVRSGEPQA